MGTSSGDVSGNAFDTNQGEQLEELSRDLAAYQSSPNAAERFLAHHAGATVKLRACHAHLLEALRAIDWADRKVLEQYVGLCGFLGRQQERTAPMVAFGTSAIARGEVALGLEAIAQAVATDIARGWGYSRRQANLVTLGETLTAAAEQVGWAPAGGIDWSNKQTRIAVVISALADEDAGARSAAALAGALDEKQFRVGVYATDAYCRRERQQFTTTADDALTAAPSARRGGGVLQRLKDAKATTWIAPTTSDVVAASVALADQLVADQTDVVLIDAEAGDVVAGLLAGWQVARSRVWIARGSVPHMPSLQGVCYFDAARYATEVAWWRDRGIEAVTMLEGVDLEHQTGEPPRRSQYGIPDSAVILTSQFDDVQQSLTCERGGRTMLDAVADVLKRNPQAVYLVIGGGETANVRRRFEAAGVGKRVGYTGRRRDLGAFLKMADVYVADFGLAQPTALLEAMNAGLATVAMNSGDDRNACPAQWLGADASVPADDLPAWTERTGRLIRDAAFRQQQARALRRRLEQHFAYNQTARGIEQLIARLIGNEAAVEGVTLEEAPARVTPRKAA